MVTLMRIAAPRGLPYCFSLTEGGLDLLMDCVFLCTRKYKLVETLLVSGIEEYFDP